MARLDENGLARLCEHIKTIISGIDAAPLDHEQAAGTITEGTFQGRVSGCPEAMAHANNPQFRDIYAGTVDLTAGTSALASGTLYFVYE